ncbi:MAG: hypothetical protein KJ725_01435 [Gammaproteobacteria bacterium]|nr:hypothetical protein [Gammaproteobacteria bacterium]
MKKDVIWGLLDQVLQSVMNLAVGILLIYFAAKEEYGLYGVGFATLLLLVGFSNAVVSTQMTVIAPTKEDQEQEIFCASLIIGFFKLLIPLSILICLSLMALSRVYEFSCYIELVYIIALISPPVIFLEIMRRYFYLKLKPMSVFLMGLVYVSLYLTVLLWAFFTKQTSLHLYALSANGLAAFIAASLFFFFFSDMKIKGAYKISSDSLKESWKDGKWALGGVLVTWGQIQGYVYVLALIQGSAMVAEANAARLFLAPMNVLSTSFTKVIMPRLVRLKINNQRRQAVSMARKILFIMISIIILYSFAIILTKDFIFKFLSKEYIYIEILIYFWSVFFMCQAFRINNSILLQAFRMFKDITLCNLVTVVLVLVGGLWVVQYYSVQGLIVVMSIGELLLATMLWFIFNKKKDTIIN